MKFKYFITGNGRKQSNHRRRTSWKEPGIDVLRSYFPCTLPTLWHKTPDGDPKMGHYEDIRRTIDINKYKIFTVLFFLLFFINGIHITLKGHFHYVIFQRYMR